MKKTIHVVFKTHLDIGFTDTAASVTDNYFRNFIPAALDLAERTRKKGEGNRFIWTTGSWLIEEYLEKGSRQMRGKMEEAILSGDIAWHALPFTVHSEYMDSSLFRAGLAISKRLDQRFGRKTIAGKMTDVPGHCRAIIPLLADAGVEFLHIGVNPASTTIDLPPLFNWRSPCGSQVTVNYVSGYGQPLKIDGFNDLLFFAHSGDNCGPPSVEELNQEFGRLHDRYPGATITGSTLDHFAERLRTVSGNLPLVTGEMGDTWIHGVGSDPLKTARFRQLSRLRRKWEESAECKEEPGFKEFTGKLLMVPEHTWGMDEKTHLKDYVNYSREDFTSARQRDSVPRDITTGADMRFCAFKLDEDDHSSERDDPIGPSYSRFESSWKEQRNYIDQAVASLQNDRFRREAEEALAMISPAPLSRKKMMAKEFREIDPPDEMEMGGFRFSFSRSTGALTFLADTGTGRSWCEKGKALGLFRYELFTASSYRVFHERYNINKDWTSGWAVPDYTKPGLENLTDLNHQFFEAERVSFFRNSHGKERLAVFLEMPGECTERFGAPKYVGITYTFPGSGEIEIELKWSDKKACRIPEALWFSFIPQFTEQAEWSIDKMGISVSPFEIINGGNRALHCTERGISCLDGGESLRIETLDIPLLSPGRPRILEFDQSQPDMREGVHFNISNNLWGTNFPMWYEDDGLARFRMVFE